MSGVVETWDRWNQLGGPKYPHDQAVRFVFRRFPAERRKGLRVLDLGCGSGVHTVFLAREGCVVTGVDISPTGIANTQRKLEMEKLDATLITESIDAISFPDGSFDCVLSIGVLESAGIDVARKAVPKAMASLVPGGVGMFLFATDRDDRIRGSNEYGLYGYQKGEVESLFASGGLIHIDRSVVTYGGGASEQNEWIVTVTR